MLVKPLKFSPNGVRSIEGLRVNDRQQFHILLFPNHYICSAWFMAFLIQSNANTCSKFTRITHWLYVCHPINMQRACKLRLHFIALNTHCGSIVSFLEYFSGIFLFQDCSCRNNNKNNGAFHHLIFSLDLFWWFSCCCSSYHAYFLCAVGTFCLPFIKIHYQSGGYRRYIHNICWTNKWVWINFNLREPH